MDAASYNQVALANRRESGNFCTVALLRARVGYSCKVVAPSAGARPVLRLVLRLVQRLVQLVKDSRTATTRQLQRLGLKAAGKGLALCAAASHAGKFCMAVCLAKG